MSKRDDDEDAAHARYSSVGLAVTNEDEVETDSQGRGQVARTTARLELGVHSGPLPPPEVLAEYERGCPGAGQAILKMAGDEQKHRHDMNQLVVGTNTALMRRGQVFGWIFISGCVFAGVYMLVHGINAGGIISLLLALVSTFGGRKVGKTTQTIPAAAGVPPQPSTSPPTQPPPESTEIAVRPKEPKR